MKVDEMLSIVKNHLVNECQHLPNPVESERVYKMISDALESAKAEINQFNASL